MAAMTVEQLVDAQAVAGCGAQGRWRNGGIAGA